MAFSLTDEKFLSSSIHPANEIDITSSVVSVVLLSVKFKIEFIYNELHRAIKYFRRVST